jgi:hypothetical protein
MVRFQDVPPCGGPHTTRNNCKSTCKVRLYQGYKDQGVIYDHDEDGNINHRFNDHTSSYTGTADENCMMAAFTWNEGKNPTNASGVDTGDALMLKDGYENLHARHSDGHGVSPRDNRFRHYDNIDGLRFQTVPSAPASKWQYHINIPSQKIHDFNDPKKITKDVYHSDNSTFNPCPGASAKYFNSKSGVRCIYPKTDTALRTLKNSTQKSNMGAMYTDLVGKFCADSNNIFKSPGDRTCLDITAGRALAVEYCKKGANIKGANGGDANCSADLTSLGDSYGTVAAKYCKTAAGRADTFCGCHNITTGVCDKHPTAAGCAKKKATFDKLVAATPKDQQNLWSGMESCFGRVCTGTGVFIPPNANQNCDKSINVCIQDIDIGSMTDSNFEAKCEIDAGDGSPSVSEPPTSSQLSAQEELKEAKAALARGDAGAQERVDAAEAALDAADESAGETGPRAYIPKSLDGLKNDRKQQIGAGAMGALVLGCMMMLLLIVASASGGGGGPVKRRFR